VKFDVVVFDFDGTVTDTGPGVRNAVRYALNKYNMPIYEDRLNEFLGPPLYLTFENQYDITPEFSNELVDTYRVYYSDKGVFECEPYEGIIDVLKALREKGIKTAVASSKPKHFLDVIIPYLHLEEYFDAVIGPELQNHEPNKTQLVQMACERLGVVPGKNVAMIGDRLYDIDGAKGAGVVSIGNLWGFGNIKEFEEHGADFVVEHPVDLLDILL